MGNRAVITTRDNWRKNGVGIYLHWHGGRDSVEAFLKYCDLKGYRSTTTDETYALARLTQVIANFFGGGLSIGIGCVHELDCNNYDNGVYIIDGWEIVDREYMDWGEQNEYELESMLVSIDNAQPANEQLGEKYIRAKEVPTASLKVGDKVFIEKFEGEIEEAEIVGVGGDEFVNGTNVEGMFYVNIFNRGDGRFEMNINNYLRKPAYRKV